MTDANKRNTIQKTIVVASVKARTGTSSKRTSLTVCNEWVASRSVPCHLFGHLPPENADLWAVPMKTDNSSQGRLVFLGPDLGITLWHLALWVMGISSAHVVQRSQSPGLDTVNIVRCNRDVWWATLPVDQIQCNTADSLLCNNFRLQPAQTWKQQRGDVHERGFKWVTSVGSAKFAVMLSWIVLKYHET